MKQGQECQCTRFSGIDFYEDWNTSPARSFRCDSEETARGMLKSVVKLLQCVTPVNMPASRNMPEERKIDLRNQLLEEIDGLDLSQYQSIECLILEPDVSLFSHQPDFNLIGIRLRASKYDDDSSGYQITVDCSNAPFVPVMNQLIDVYFNSEN